MESVVARVQSSSAEKVSLYRQILQDIVSVLEGEPDRTARMATVCAMLSQALTQTFWVGFYVVDVLKQDELVVGPYQGTPGCLRIGFARGVCGAAARTRTTQIVADVHAFPGHIACDSRSNSEIVVPVLAPTDELIAVLDLDSTDFGTFDNVDAHGLEEIVRAVFGRQVF